MIQEATEKVVVPADPMGFEGFLGSVKEAETALGKGGDLPQAELEQFAKDIALKKNLFSEQIGGMKSAQLKDLAKQSKLKHWQWANKDELVTLFTETDASKIAAAKDSIEAKHAAWSVKHGGKKAKQQKPKEAKPAAIPPSPPPAPSSKPEPEPAPPKPESKPPATEVKPAYVKKGAEFETVDDDWKQKGQPSKFKFSEKANVGGAHEKEFWVDDNGDKWLFKPVKKTPDNFLADGDEVAYRIGRLIDPNAINVRSVELNGRKGSIQKWRTDLKSKYDFAGMAPEELRPEELSQIQREHVVDWLIANHDGHAKQLLRTKDGGVLGIDKGQLFKHLGSDQLSIDYHPNSVHGEQEPYYNTIFRAARKKWGKLFG